MPDRRRLKKAIWLALLLTGLLHVAVAASAQELQPYPNNSISDEQWQIYFYEVENTHRNSAQRVASQHLIIFKDRKNATSWTFTQMGHPAHPSWITRKVVTNGDEASIQQIGYYACELDQFAEFFEQQLQLNKSIETKR